MCPRGQVSIILMIPKVFWGTFLLSSWTFTPCFHVPPLFEPSFVAVRFLMDHFCRTLDLTMASMVLVATHPSFAWIDLHHRAGPFYLTVYLIFNYVRTFPPCMRPYGDVV